MVRYVLALVPPTNSILKVVQQTYRPDGWFATVLDSNGRIVARSSRHDEFFGFTAAENLRARMTGEHGVLETVDLEGRPSITGYHRSSHQRLARHRVGAERRCSSRRAVSAATRC